VFIETPQVKEFRQKLHEFPREKLLEIIEEQNPSYIFDINRIEWVFKNKLSHLNDDHGNPIVGRDLSHAELVRLIDPPFMFSKDMMRQGFGEDIQRQIHIASDPIIWSKNILGATPRAYQALVLREPNDNIVLRWGRRLGKALDLETDIPTPMGWKKMADLQEGDQVFDENGDVCNVTAVTDVQHDHVCYKVEFSDGSFLYADAEHEWAVHDQADRMAITNGQPRPLQHVTTEEMSKNVLGPYSTTRTENNYSVPLTKAVQYPTQNLKVHPWVYGYMVANGYPSSNNVKVLPKDIDDVSAQFSQYGYELKNIKGNKYQVVGLESYLFEPYIIKNEYMFGSVEQRTQLLTGICDARATTTTDYIEFQTGDKAFVDQVDELVCSLGAEVRRREKINRVKGIDYGTSYKAYWLANFTCFSLARKQPNRPSKGTKQLVRMVVSVEKVDSRPVKCITVDSRSRLYLAGRQFVPTHNSYVLSMYILWYSFVHEKARTLVLAPAKTQVGLIYDQILELSELSPIVSGAITKKPRSPQYEIYLSNGSIVRLFTTGFRSGQKADNARGQEADMIVLDEMDYMGADDLVALMAMLQKTNPDKAFNKKLIGASTPTGQRGTYWRWNTDPDEGYSSFWFPSYVNPLWDKEEESKARRRYRNEQHYRHEIEADWGEDAEGVYPRKYVDMAFRAKKLSQYDVFKPDHENCIYSLGVDWDKHGAGVNIVVAEVDKKKPGSSQVSIVYRDEIIKGDFTYIESIEEIIRLDSKFQFKHVYVDQGAGEVQAEMLHKYGLENPHTKLHTKTKACHFSNTIELRDPYTRQIEKKRLKPFMIENLVFHLEQERIAFQDDDDELYLQLISYIKIRETESGNSIFAAGGDTVDHAHDALLLALFAFTENYDSLFQGIYKDGPKAISNEFFITSAATLESKEEEVKKERTPARNVSRGASFSRSKAKRSNGSIKRPMF
jgi:replicative DNA helicase